MSFCVSLAAVHSLEGLFSLQILDLRLCSSLTTVPPPVELSSFLPLYMIVCESLPAVQSLEGLWSCRQAS